MQDVKHRIGLLWRRMATSIHRPKIYPKQGRGRLSPEQFVAAGDMLVAKSPVWEWMGGSGDFHQPFLPTDKQFLLFKHVVCNRRFSTLKKTAYDTKCVDRDEMAWIASEAEEEVIVSHISSSNDSGNPSVSLDWETKRMMKQMRYYDVSITYDAYYQTPHVYLCGFNHNGLYLTAGEMMEDVDEDYVLKTVTIDPHPFHLYSHDCISIHPCMHAATMEKMLSMMEEGGRTAREDQYLFLFIKFIMSVVPSINFDYTTEVAIH